MAYHPEEFPTEEPDPFDALASPGMVAGYVWKVAGEDGLRDLLGRDVPASLGTAAGGKPLDRETVLDIASELSQAGLRKASAICTEIAASKPSMTDLIFCCYTKPPYSETPGNAANIRAWQMSEQRRQNERELGRQQRFKTKPKN